MQLPKFDQKHSWCWPQKVAATERKLCLLQNACVFQLDQLVQIEILETLAARQFDELRRDSHHFGADDFVDVGLEARGLQRLDEFLGDSLYFERDPFVLVGINAGGADALN